MRRVERWRLVLATGLVLGTASAAEHEDSEPLPSAELLLFLAEFPDEAGDVLDLVEPTSDDNQDTDNHESCDQTDCVDPDPRDPDQS